MEKTTIYFASPADIPLVAKLSGTSEDVLMEQHNAAAAEGKLLVFQAEVTPEQYREIQRWKNEH